MFASLFLYLYPQLFMESSQNFNLLPFSVHFFCWSDKVYHKQEVRFLLYLLGQIATDILTLIYWIKTWPFTVFNYHSWQLGNCPLSLTNANCFFATFWFCCKIPLLVRHALPVITIMSPICCLRTTTGLEIKQIMYRNEDCQRLFLPWKLQWTVPQRSIMIINNSAWSILI